MTGQRPPLQPPRPPAGPSCQVSPVGCALWLGMLLLFAWGVSALIMWVTR